MSDEAVYRTAPATPGLLITKNIFANKLEKCQEATLTAEKGALSIAS